MKTVVVALKYNQVSNVSWKLNPFVHIKLKIDSLCIIDIHLPCLRSPWILISFCCRSLPISVEISLFHVSWESQQKMIFYNPNPTSLLSTPLYRYHPLRMLLLLYFGGVEFHLPT